MGNDKETKMAREFFVIDADNNTAWDDDDRPQVFKTFEAAKECAFELATLSPGQNIKIVGVEIIVCCDVSEPQVKFDRLGSPTEAR